MHFHYDILIIDDSKFIIELLTDIIESKGLTCKAVENLSSAMDVNLPGANGYKFCEKIKSTEKFKNILIYYFTGVSEAEVSIKTLETRADGYLKKSFDLSNFNDILEHLD
ncbi:MAG: response regulator [Promethearchaeota archaeon]|nr:MAG: response regulator [Candidatus Lokiarchaeota archaeon]